MVKNKETQKMELTTINALTMKDCELSRGHGFNEGDQDTMEELMTMEDKEISFWLRVEKTPNHLKDLEFNWEEIVADYKERERIRRIESIKNQKALITKISKQLEMKEINKIKKDVILPKQLLAFVSIDVHDDKNGDTNIYLKSIEWDVDLCDISKLFKYESWAKQRQEFYLIEPNRSLHNYKGWLRSVWEESFNLGDDVKCEKIKLELSKVGVEINVDDYVKQMEKEKG
jgi:hypothetical protein